MGNDDKMDSDDDGIVDSDEIMNGTIPVEYHVSSLTDQLPTFSIEVINTNDSPVLTDTGFQELNDYFEAPSFDNFFEQFGNRLFHIDAFNVDGQNNATISNNELIYLNDISGNDYHAAVYNNLSSQAPQFKEMVGGMNDW